MPDASQLAIAYEQQGIFGSSSKLTIGQINDADDGGFEAGAFVFEALFDHRLFPNVKSAEQAYFRETAVFPIMHAVAIRKDLAAEHHNDHRQGPLVFLALAHFPRKQ